MLNILLNMFTVHPKKKMIIAHIYIHTNETTPLILLCIRYHHISLVLTDELYTYMYNVYTCIYSICVYRRTYERYI